MILIGHNGAGKSTLINYLLNFYTSTSQHPFLENFSQYIEPLKKEKLGYAPEAAHLDLSMSAYNYFTMMAALRSIEKYDIEFLLSQVKLDVDIHRAIKTYSKGMKQRLLLALALLGDPETVILDEPTSGLDPFGRAAIEGLLISLKEQHNFIISTHSLALAINLEEEIWILKEGKIVHQGYFDSVSALEKELKNQKPSILQ